MGYWEATCAFTRTTIFCGEPIVLILFTEEVLRFYDGGRPNFDLLTDGEYLLGIYTGDYDNYGGIEGIELGDDLRNRFTLLFHQEVWEACAQEYDRWGEVTRPPFIANAACKAHPHLSAIPHMESLVKIATLCSLCRRPLFTLNDTRQEWDGQQWQLFAHQLTGRVLWRQARELDERYQEEAEATDAKPTGADA